MTLIEWRPIAERINRLWPPAMDARIAEEYHAVLEEFPAAAVDKAVGLIAKQPRNFRPDVGLLYTTAEARVRALHEALSPPETDPVTAEEHQRVLAEEHQRQNVEHRRRHQAVVDLLRATGYRIPLTEMPSLMAEKSCTAEQFDRRLKYHRAEAPRQTA